MHDRSAVKNSYSTYVWSKVDSCFCEALYILLPKEKSSIPWKHILWKCSLYYKKVRLYLTVRDILYILVYFLGRNKTFSKSCVACCEGTQSAICEHSIIYTTIKNLLLVRNVFSTLPVRFPSLSKIDKRNITSDYFYRKWTF